MLTDFCYLRKKMFGKGILVVVLHFLENILCLDGYVQVHVNILHYLWKVFHNWKGQGCPMCCLQR